MISLGDSVLLKINTCTTNRLIYLHQIYIWNGVCDILLRNRDQPAIFGVFTEASIEALQRAQQLMTDCYLTAVINYQHKNAFSAVSQN